MWSSCSIEHTSGQFSSSVAVLGVWFTAALAFFWTCFVGGAARFAGGAAKSARGGTRVRIRRNPRKNQLLPAVFLIK
jgi:hypothetical protein